jgi:ABC-2 type transport system permease protein
MKAHNILSIARRELASYFNSPVAYLVVTVYLILSGALFFNELFLQGQADMRGFFGIAPLLLFIIVPFLTMRLVAEERAQGTLELLLTMPLTDWEVVLGKYLAVLGLLGVLTLLTTPFAVTVSLLGPLDKGATLAAYIGMLLMSGVYAAIGLMASSLTRSQIVAALIALFIGFGLYIFGALQPILPPFLAQLANAMSINARFQSIARGVIDTRDVLYFGTLSAACLLVAQASLESRRWR